MNALPCHFIYIFLFDNMYLVNNIVGNFSLKTLLIV